MDNNQLRITSHSQQRSLRIRQLSYFILWIILIGLVPILQGCPQDKTPQLEEENSELKKLAAKLESMIITLQEGNRVLQEQIDRLNKELREKQQEQDQRLKSAQETGKDLTTERKALAQQVAELTKENQKLQNDAQWLRRQRELFRDSMTTLTHGAKAQTFSVGLSPMIEATKQALLRHGYSTLAKMATDQKAVFVTERKTSASPSLELPGFRNQYVLVLEGAGTQATTLKIKAQYEKISQDGKTLGVDDSEIADIELRMIRAVEDVLQESTNSSSNP
ncbi:hypothetical protein [Candidatus Nitronereus thalassa]|uniref:Chromosome partition protein Smc n=1 Tax=Candidatus Nitronereus thalassa TaxID=3020898 RepID=A0ABU3KCN9_9BACT|nr:hypothetical protein [Candidatus Nitronereus thalassa]MDT7044197.1 hypothetical protein [Candidatus Nitronereus thalassa]